MRDRLTAVLAAGVMLTLAACGGGDDNPNGEDDADGLIDVVVGVSSVVDVSPVYLGIQEGFFEDHGLNVTPQNTSGGGAALLPSVISGEVDFAYGNLVSLMIAHEQGLDVRVVAHGSSSPGRGSEQGALLVLPDSDIQSAADLEGRTVAVNSLESLTEVMVRDAIATEGGDPDAVELVELSLGDMQAALENGDVDAITTFEPFTTIGEQDGARSVYQIFDLTESGRTFIAGYFTSGAFAEENPDLVEAFTAAIGESLDFAEENPDEVRAIVPTYLDLDQSIIDEMAMPLFGSEMDIDGAQELADIVTDYGVLEQPMDVREFFVLPEGAE